MFSIASDINPTKSLTKQTKSRRDYLLIHSWEALAGLRNSDVDGRASAVFLSHLSLRSFICWVGVPQVLGKIASDIEGSHSPA
jgi:hypothetical protein